MPSLDIVVLSPAIALIAGIPPHAPLAELCHCHLFDRHWPAWPHSSRAI